MAPVPSNITGDGLKLEIDQAVQMFRTALEDRLEDLRITVRALDTQVNVWTTKVDQHLGTLGTQMDQLQE